MEWSNDACVYNGNGKEVWDELKERYRQSNGPHIYQLRKDLVTTTQGNLSVKVYYAKITTIWQELVEYRLVDECTCEGSKKMIDFLNSEFVMTFLMTLNESYSHIRAQILLIDPLPPINKVFSLIIQEDRQRSIGSSPSLESITLLANFERRFPSEKSKKKDTRPICSNCGYRGHVVDKCDKLHGYPPDHRLASNNSVHQQRQSNTIQAGNEKMTEASN